MSNARARGDTSRLRLAVVHGLVGALEDAGKIKIQKLIYLLQEGYGVPLHYVFKMHHYGPFCEDIETDIGRLQMTGYVSVSRDPDGYGFHVRPSGEAEQEWKALFNPLSDHVQRVASLFGNRPAYDLELIATIHFVSGLLEDRSEGNLLRQVKSLKPRFEEEFIKERYSELRKEGLLK